MATASITKDNSTFYTITCNATVTNNVNSSAATVNWNSKVTFGQWYEWGVGLKTYVNGAQVKDVTGYTTSANGTCCSSSGTKSIAKTHSTQTITVKATSYSTTVNGYGGVGSTTTASLTVTIPALSSYIVSYDANGGSGAPSSSTKWYGEKLTLSATKPTRTGYTFVGWATSSTSTTASYSAGGEYISNSAVTLYAVWSASSTCTISFNANGGSGAPSSITHIINTTSTIPLAKPTRDGYWFLGWSTSSSATDATYRISDPYVNNSFTNGSIITLYAVWKKLIQVFIRIPDGSSVQSIQFNIN